ncbi:MAG: response regulator [Deltaproteobacteria bacterium]|nr:response regulator [Deltaproteobacteria bacterium]
MPKTSSSQIIQKQQQEIEALRARLESAEENLRAIRSGEVDALVISTDQGKQIFTLKEADYAFRVLVENMGEGAVTFTEKGLIVYCNSRFAQIVAKPLEQIMGGNICSLIIPEDRATFTALMESKASKRKEIEVSLISAGGLRIPVRLTITFLPGGNPQSFCMIVTDMTETRRREAEIKQARDNLEQRVAERTADLKKEIARRMEVAKEKERIQAQLFQAQKMEALGLLTGGMAHDFNNILTIILGNAGFSLEALRKDEPLYESINEIKKAGERAASLIRQLLAFSRKEVRSPEVLDLNEMIRGLEKMLRRLIPEDIELVTILEHSLWKIHIDPAQMDQVILNLVINARDAMPEGGTLTIETTNVELDPAYFLKHGVENTPGPYVMLAVTDTGIGMNKEICAKIFDPFFTTKEKGVGTGLGLATVFGIVRQNEGYIWAYSEPGHGTTMKVYIPRSRETTEPGGKKETRPHEVSGTETILVVEDDDAVRKFAVRVLRRLGYQVLEAQNSQEALRVSQEFTGPIHLLLTDVIMPEINGKVLAERLRSQRPEIRTIYMSGYTHNIILQKGILPSDTRYIQKPFTPDSLARKVREAMEN